MLCWFYKNCTDLYILFPITFEKLFKLVPNFEQDFAPDSPLGNFICRLVDAKEVADVAVFLCSDKSSSISGEAIATDGGAGSFISY